MTPEQRNQTSRLFVALEYGEQLAHRCANHQLGLMDSEPARRFLRKQVRQEAFHAQLFKQAAHWLKPTHRYDVPSNLSRFAQQLERAIENNNSTECLLASQIVLEGFGEQILQRLNKGMDKHNIGFKHQRYTILGQEQSHFNFGLVMLKTDLENGDTTPDFLHSQTLFYLEFVDQIIEEMADIFISLDEDANEYKTSLVQLLPEWLHPPLS